ncbi:MAG: L,D-transpeptidase family protein [Syntrophaceae bacterium]|nr:L,D-transpeptidase family protein [Syntrophaceae bacterium]
MGKKQTKRGRYFYPFTACIITSILMCGCTQSQIRSSFREANEYFSQGSYITALSKYEQIIAKYPTASDRVLFEMGIVYAHSGNWQKDYPKAMECFQKLIQDYPESEYRQASEAMISHINNIKTRDGKITAQQAQIENLEKEMKSQGGEILSLQKKIAALEDEVTKKVYPIQNGPADQIVVEKKERRLTLISKGQILKQYKIALGGEPNGPKEKLGDNKTPEGTYVIDSRNKDSRYHLSLHISYPNNEDRKRAKELGVSPGGDIMIHGIKNGFSWVGDFHTVRDWTEGCIAVTDEEIEEIDKLVPNGTVVEIRP